MRITETSLWLFQAGYFVERLTGGEFTPSRNKTLSRSKSVEVRELLAKVKSILTKVLVNSQMNDADWHTASLTLIEIEKLLSGGRGHLHATWYGLTNECQVLTYPTLGWALLGRIVALKQRKISPLKRHTDMLSRCLQVKNIRGWFKGSPVHVYTHSEKQINHATQKLPGRNASTQDTKDVYIFRNNFMQLWVNGELIWSVSKPRAAVTILSKLYGANQEDTKIIVNWSIFKTSCSYSTPARFLKHHPALRTVIEYRSCTNSDSCRDWEINLKSKFSYDAE